MRRQGPDPCRRPRQGRRRQARQVPRGGPRASPRRSSACSSSPTRPDPKGSSSARSSSRRPPTSTRSSTCPSPSTAPRASTSSWRPPPAAWTSRRSRERDPKAIYRAWIDHNLGVQPFQARAVARHLGLKGDTAATRPRKLVSALVRAYLETDASLAEINPLLITKGGDVMALDAKMNFDDNALFRHKDIARDARPRRGGPARGRGVQVRPQLHQARRQHRLHGQRRRARHGHDGHHQARRRRAGQLPRRRRRRAPGGGQERLPASWSPTRT